MQSQSSPLHNDMKPYQRERNDLPHAPASLCQKCGDSGYYSVPQGLVPCDCLLRKVKAVKFGENYADKTIENFIPKSLSGKNVQRMLTHSPDTSYLITGAVGLGKTHLLAGLYEKLWHQYRFHTLVRKELDLLEWLKTEKHWMLELQDNAIRLVQIDDLGKVKLAEWDIEKFFRFYDFISSNKIILQITTNLTPVEIKDVYGNAITDRLFRNNKCQILTIRTADADKVESDKNEM